MDTGGGLEGCDWLLNRFMQVNFSKLTDSNQIFRNDLVCLHYHLCKVSSIIECIIFYLYELSLTTIYSMVLFGLRETRLREYDCKASSTRQKNCVTDAETCLPERKQQCWCFESRSPRLQSPAISITPAMIT